VRRPRAQAKLFIHQAAVKSAVEALRATIAQQIYITGKCEFLVNSQILNWNNKACFREELPLGSTVLKKLATSDSFITEAVVFKLLRLVDANPRHAITRKVTNTTCSLLKFIQVSLSKVTGRHQ
jgi:hypothetical protein